MVVAWNISDPNVDMTSQVCAAFGYPLLEGFLILAHPSTPIYKLRMKLGMA